MKPYSIKNIMNASETTYVLPNPSPYVESCLMFMPSRVFVSPWTVAHQAPLSMEFSRKDWNGLPSSPLGDLSNPGIEPASPALQADSFPLSLRLLSSHFFIMSSTLFQK